MIAKSKPKRHGYVRLSELNNITKSFRRRVHELEHGINWAYSDEDAYKMRSKKAEGIRECIDHLKYIIKQERVK